jgi:hypothetical protein
MEKRNLRRNNSGQVIIITALLVVTLFLSTAIYVIQTEKNVPAVVANQNDVLTEYEQSIKNTLISALANITNGGDTSFLTADLTELNAAFISHSYRAMLQMVFAPLNTAPYHDGVWVLWGPNGQGISSAYVGFDLNYSASSSFSGLKFDSNVTSEINLSGKYLQINNTINQVDLIVNVLNEGKPALAQNFTFSFQNSAEWIPASSPEIINFGNGTYEVLFDAVTDQPSNPFIVSGLCQDQRGIVIGANTTCTRTG